MFANTVNYVVTHAVQVAIPNPQIHNYGNIATEFSTTENTRCHDHLSAYVIRLIITDLHKTKCELHEVAR